MSESKFVDPSVAAEAAANAGLDPVGVSNAGFGEDGTQSADAANALAEAEALVDSIEPSDDEADPIHVGDPDAPGDQSGLDNDEVLKAEIDATDEEIIAGLGQVDPSQMSQAEQAKFAAMLLTQVDDDDTIIPNLPLNLDNLTLWALESVMINGEPGVIITFANTSLPRGIPIVLTRDRGLKFASQLKKRLLTGPDLQQRAAAAGLSVPPSAGGGLILPGQ